MHIGIYENNQLIQTYHSHEHTSEILPVLFKEILEQYTPKTLFFARGPGSFMAIKITYIFLKSMSIALEIPLLACDGFVFNEGRPIRAMRNLYFVKNQNEIKTERFDEAIEQSFALPNVLDTSVFHEDTEPLYLLPAV